MLFPSPCRPSSARHARAISHLAFPPQALYPDSGGVAPTLTRPVILLIVRHKRRGLGNSDDVRMVFRSFCESVVCEGTSMRIHLRSSIPEAKYRMRRLL